MAVRFRNKIPALLKPQGQPLKRKMINAYDIKSGGKNSEVVRIRGRVGFTKQDISWPLLNCSVPPFGNDIHAAEENPEKIIAFCNLLPMCEKALSIQNQELKEKINRLEYRVNNIKELIGEYDNEVFKMTGKTTAKLKETMDRIKNA